MISDQGVRTPFGVTFDSRLRSGHQRSETECGGGYSLAFSRLESRQFDRTLVDTIGGNEDI